MIKLEELMNLLDVKEEDAIKAILNLVSPPPPPATRENWIRLSTFGHSAPSTKELWKKLEDSNFRCHRCGSQMRLSFNHINGNPKDHRLENLEVICYACNRSLSKKATVDKNQHLKVALTAIQIWKETGHFPTFAEIRKKAGVKQIGGATYLLKFIKKRLEEKNKYNNLCT
jgi:hypothetical protein